MGMVIVGGLGASKTAGGDFAAAGHFAAGFVAEGFFLGACFLAGAFFAGAGMCIPGMSIGWDIAGAATNAVLSRNSGSFTRTSVSRD